MKISALIGYAAALIASTAMAAPHPAFLIHKQGHRFVAGTPAGSKTLYDQNKDPAGTAILSDNFAGGFSSYDSQGADDFVVPGGHTWIVKEVDVTGVYFNGPGPALSENVFFYKDKGGLPGHLIVQCPNQNGTDGGFGSFAIVLAKACKAQLRGGKTYWVSVQANMDFTQGGEWGWNLSSDTSGNPAARRDSGSCAAWCRLESDLMFALKGKDRIPAPD